MMCVKNIRQGLATERHSHVGLTAEARRRCAVADNFLAHLVGHLHEGADALVIFRGAGARLRLLDLFIKQLELVKRVGHLLFVLKIHRATSITPFLIIARSLAKTTSRKNSYSSCVSLLISRNGTLREA